MLISALVRCLCFLYMAFFTYIYFFYIYITLFCECNFKIVHNTNNTTCIATTL